MVSDQNPVTERERQAREVLEAAVRGEHDGIELQPDPARYPLDMVAADDAVRAMLAFADRIPAKVEAVREQVRAEVINAPETADFMAAVPLEAAHQRERWGVEHDAGKTPFDWFWLIGYLVQKAADAAVRGDDEKAMHHTISTAAALGNWHAALSGKAISMRPGIGPDNGGEKPGSAFALASALPSTPTGDGK